MRLTLFLVLITIPIFCVASEEETSKKGRIGPGKAVLEASEADGLKLSEKAFKNLDLDFMSVDGKGSAVTVPASALVRFQDFSAVYRLRDGFLKMLEVEASLHGGSATILSKDLKAGDRIVTQNPALIRVIDLDVWGPEADACVD